MISKEPSARTRKVASTAARVSTSSRCLSESSRYALGFSRPVALWGEVFISRTVGILACTGRARHVESRLYPHVRGQSRVCPRSGSGLCRQQQHGQEICTGQPPWHGRAGAGPVRSRQGARAQDRPRTAAGGSRSRASRFRSLRPGGVRFHGRRNRSSEQQRLACEWSTFP